MADEIEKEEYHEYLHENNIETKNNLQLFKEKNVDIDGDGLRDFEEEYFGTNKNMPDTDNDGYSDYEEIKN